MFINKIEMFSLANIYKYRHLFMYIPYQDLLVTGHEPSCSSNRQCQSDLNDSSYPLDESSCHLNDLLD